LQREAHGLLQRNCESGGAKGYPLMDVTVRLLEVRTNDPPDPAVPMLASITIAMRDALYQARTVVLEPLMSLEVRAPEDCLGAVLKDLNARRAEIRETNLMGNVAMIRGFVALKEMFGYSTQIRSLTQGRGSFSMEPYDYQPAPGMSQ
jgi:elongation factor G